MYNSGHQGVFQCFFTVFIVIDLKRESYVNTVYNTIALYMLIVQNICSNLIIGQNLYATDMPYG